MSAIARFTLLGLVLGLSACSMQLVPSPQPPTIQNLPSGAPYSHQVPPTPTLQPVQRTSASFAPPPGGASHWDPKLGVYVLEDQADTYYRQRTYYQWSNGWNWSTAEQGPWQATDSGGVPAGLGRLHP